MKYLTSVPGIELNQVIGRDSSLEEIDGLLSDSNPKIIVITGQAGMGKTTTVLAYLHSEKYNAQFNNIAWVSAGINSLREDIVNSFIKSNDEISFQSDLKSEKNFELVSKYLKKQIGRTLLIIDNEDNIQELNACKQYLLDLHINIIITSRAQPENFNLYHLEPLTAENAFELFAKNYSKENNSKLTNEILQKINYHSFLTIILAKVCQNNDKLNLKQLLEIVSKQSYDDPKLNTEIEMPKKFGSERNLKNTGFKGHLTSLFKESKLSEQETYYLKIFLLLPSEKDYSYDFLIDLFFIKPENLTSFNENLNKLASGGWLNKRYDKNAKSYYGVHQLVQISLNLYLTPDLVTCKSIIWRVALKLSFADQKINRLQEKLIWSEIGDSISSYFGVPEITGNTGEIENLALLYNNLALCFQDFCKFQKALEYQLIALKLNESIIKEPNLSIAKNYNNLSTLYRDLGDFNKALEMQLKTLKIKEKILAKNHSSLARSFNNLSLLYSEMKDFDKALDTQFKAISIRETFKEDPNTELANSFNNISAIYSKKNDEANALKYQLKALELYQIIYKTPHPAMATALNNLALIYNAVGNTKKSLESHLLALEIRKATLNEYHTDLENSYSNLAILYMDTLQFEKALNFINNSIHILTHIFPPNHPQIERAIQIKNAIHDNLKMMN